MDGVEFPFFRGGVIIGLSLAGRQIMSDDMVLTGTVIIVELVLTLAIAGRQRS